MSGESSRAWRELWRDLPSDHPAPVEPVDEVERCSCEEALALRRQLAATAELVAAIRRVPRRELEWWARHGGDIWRPFGRAALAVLDRGR